MTATTVSPALRIFTAQKQKRAGQKKSTAAYRINMLLKLKAAILKREKEICSALQVDLGKPAFESEAYEVIFVLAEIDFAVRRLSSWMKPHRVSSNLLNLMLRNRIVYEPKGLCLIMAPWNYPFQLLIAPLVSALAAGNSCLLKPSELAPNVSAVIAVMFQDCFPENEIALLEGGSELARELLQLPFQHIFFTGSSAIGKKVMEAASQHLASVTLELGGKSPVVILEDADLNKAAAKITWGKLINAGQTCIAPDYVFVHEKQRDEFCKLVTEYISRYYYQNNILNKDDFGKIISESHFNRLKNLLDDCKAAGGEIITGGICTEEDRRIYPTVITHVDTNCRLMQEEIFGPVLPVLTYSQLSEVTNYIKAGDKPLALYIFGNNRSVVEEILDSTSSGGVCVNDVMLQVSNPHLPFGGINNSGIGGSHGFHGFKAFSHERAVMYQSRFFDMGRIVYPPYKGKEKIMKLLRRIM